MRKRLVMLLLTTVVISGGGIALLSSSSEPKNVLASVEAELSEPIEEYELYSVRDEPDLSVFSVRQDKLLLLITTPDVSKTYCSVYTNQIFGTPIALADDLSAILIENDEGKFVLSTADGEDPSEETTITPFDETDDSCKWNELYYWSN